MDRHGYDVVVVGGGAAGLAGALVLARSRRSVLVVDAGRPRNAPAAHLHGYLGSDGLPPGELLARGRAEVAGYGGRVLAGTVTGARPADGGFTVTLADGSGVRARRLLLATGALDELPDVPGVAELWGRDVLHCPYCHGWEARGRAIGVLGTGPAALHAVLLWRQLSDDVTLFRHTMGELAEESWEQLAARGVAVVDGRVTALEVEDDRLVGVRVDGGTVVPRSVLVVASRPSPPAALLTGLGLATADLEMSGTVLGSHLPAEPTGATTVPGVWVAGNTTDPMGQLLHAAGSGLRAGAMINADLAAEDTGIAVAARRHGTGAAPRPAATA